MNKRRIYLILQAAVCVALAALLAMSAVSILREGMARKARNPLESVYTPRIVSERLAPIAPLFFAALGLLAAGLLLDVKDEGAEKPVRDAETVRDLAAGRIAAPSEAMKRERAAQRRLQWIGRGAFAACMAPVAVYLANPAHFPGDDPEAMFLGLTRVFLPCAIAALGALSATAALRERSLLRETEAAKARLREERAAGLAPVSPTPAKPRGRGAAQAAIIVAAVALIVAGIFNGSARDVLHKAITICTECVGLG